MSRRRSASNRLERFISHSDVSLAAIAIILIGILMFAEPGAFDSRLKLGITAMAVHDHTILGGSVPVTKLQDDATFETFFTESSIHNSVLELQFYHNSLTSQPVWIEAEENLGYSLSTRSALPYETVELTINLLDGGKVPAFRLHVGNASEVFEFGIRILNVQSYPVVGGNWVVSFQTAGTADLAIAGADGTRFDKDLRFLQLRCGDSVMDAAYDGNMVFYPRYSCAEAASETSLVLTPGKHTLEFRFGDEVAYAYNDASPANITNPKTMLIWGQDGAAARLARFMIWNGTAYSTAENATQQNNNKTARFIEMGSDPNSNNVTFVMSRDFDATYNAIDAAVWNGTDWIGNITLSANVVPGYRAVDMEYDNSSRAMAVWGDKLAGIAVYALWNGTGWQFGNTTNVTAGTNPFQVELAADTLSNNIILAIIDGNNYVHAQVWNGTGWGNNITLETSSDYTQHGIDAEYDAAGKAVVVWNDAANTVIQYRIWNGTAWGAEGNTTDVSALSSPILELGENPRGDNMVLMSVDSASDVYAQVWDGKAWGNNVSLSTTSEMLYHGIDAKYDINGQALVVWDDKANRIAKYRTWNGTAWSAEANTQNVTTGAYPAHLQLAADPNSTEMLLIEVSTTLRAFSQVWNGTAWGNTKTLTSPGNNTWAYTKSIATEYLRTGQPYNDTEAPVIALISPLNNTLNSTSNIITFQYSAYDTSFSIASCSLILNSVTNQTNTSITEYVPQSLTSLLADGQYNWSVNCTDTSPNANTNSSEIRNLTVKTVPSASLVYPPNDYNTSLAVINFTCNATDQIGLSNITLWHNISGAWQANATNAVGGAFNQTSFLLTTIPDGIYAWTCQANSTDGDASFATENHTFTVDRTPPAVNLESPANNTLYQLGPTVIFSYNTTDALMPVANCSLIINNITNQTSTSIAEGVSQNFTVAMAATDYNWSVNCTDVLGNTNSSLIFNLSVLFANGASCALASQCAGTFCVHLICRSASAYCGDAFCDAPTETCSNCPTDCGGCGGGGGGGGAPYVPPPQPPPVVPDIVVTTEAAKTEANVQINSVPAGETATADVSSAGLFVSSMTFTSTQNVTNMSMNITPAPSATVKQAEDLFTIGEIAYEGIFLNYTQNLSQKIRNITFTFAVNKSWVQNNTASPDTITLNRIVGNVTQSLPTKGIGANDTVYFFNATTENLSLFVVSAVSSPLLCTICTAGEWSTCIDGQQSRLTNICGQETGYTCRPTYETRVCELPCPPGTVPPACTPITEPPWEIIIIPFIAIALALILILRGRKPVTKYYSPEYSPSPAAMLKIFTLWRKSQ